MSGGPQVGVVMGSDSDWPVLAAAVEVLAEFGIGCETDVVSAHRMPREMIDYGSAAAGRGLPSLLSIVQMPAGIPVATVAVGGARNAVLLAVRILAASDEPLRERMVAFQRQLRDTAKAKGAALRARLAGGDELPPGS